MMWERAYRPCETVEEGCDAPPGLADSYTRATCWACGHPVCLPCSRRREWHGYPRRRVCLGCDEEENRLVEDLERSKKNL